MQSNKKSIPDLGGYQNGWPIGSMFENEGIKLYQIITKYKPSLIVEVGCHHGCSTAWMAAAVKYNGFGSIISYDINKDAGKLIPDYLRDVIEIRYEDAFTCEVPANIDLLFEDGEHYKGFTKTILQRFKANIVIVHDYFHRSCHDTIKNEFDYIYGKPDETYIEPPSDCGLAIKYVNSDAIKKRIQPKNQKGEYKETPERGIQPETGSGNSHGQSKKGKKKKKVNYD